jgi:hypothetical protein
MNEMQPLKFRAYLSESISPGFPFQNPIVQIKEFPEFFFILFEEFLPGAAGK